MKTVRMRMNPAKRKPRKKLRTRNNPPAKRPTPRRRVRLYAAAGGGRGFLIRAFVEYRNQLGDRWWTGTTFTMQKKDAKHYTSREVAARDMGGPVKRYAAKFHRNFRALEIYPA